MSNTVLLKLFIEGVMLVTKSINEAKKAKDVEAIKDDVYSAWGERFGRLREQRGTSVSETPTERDKDG